MAHAKKVNFHILSQIVFPADFGPGVLGPVEPKGQNGQTYNTQFHQEPSKNSAKPFMEQKMLFGLVLGRVAILKIKQFGLIMSNF